MRDIEKFRSEKLKCLHCLQVKPSITFYPDRPTCCISCRTRKQREKYADPEVAARKRQKVREHYYRSRGLSVPNT